LDNIPITRFDAIREVGDREREGSNAPDGAGSRRFKGSKRFKGSIGGAWGQGKRDFNTEAKKWGQESLGTEKENRRQRTGFSY
jgi:hypothetical protein